MATSMSFQKAFREDSLSVYDCHKKVRYKMGAQETSKQKINRIDN